MYFVSLICVLDRLNSFYVYESTIICISGYLPKIMIKKKSPKNMDTLPTQEEEEGEKISIYITMK